MSKLALCRMESGTVRIGSALCRSFRHLYRLSKQEGALSCRAALGPKRVRDLPVRAREEATGHHQSEERALSVTCSVGSLSLILVMRPDCQPLSHPLQRRLNGRAGCTIRISHPNNTSDLPRTLTDCHSKASSPRRIADSPLAVTPEIPASNLKSAMTTLEETLDTLAIHPRCLVFLHQIFDKTGHRALAMSNNIGRATTSIPRVRTIRHCLAQVPSL